MLTNTTSGAGSQIAKTVAPAQTAQQPTSQFMEQHLGMASELRQLFGAREALEFKKPVEKRKMLPLTGVSACTALFESELPEDLEPYTPPVSRMKKQALAAEARLMVNKSTLEKQVEAWDPESEKKISSDPYKTIIVARLPYTATEDVLIDEFSRYGPVVSSRIVKDLDGKSRGYGFVEFETTSDAKAAYNYAHGKVIGNRKCAVDLERARTGTGFKPRRLGGGLGRTRSALRENREPPSKVVEVEPDIRRRGPDRGNERDRDRRGGDRNERGGDRHERGGRDRERDRYGERGERGSRGDRGGRGREREDASRVDRYDKTGERGGGGRDRERGDRNRPRTDRYDRDDRQRGGDRRDRDRDRRSSRYGR